MSSAPSGWQNPKTNWNSADVPLPTDFNRIEGDIQAIELGQRTLDPSQPPGGNTGSLRQLLDWFANRIRAITGASNWYDSPATTLAAAKSHMDATSGIHGATSSATANRLVIRDPAGRAQFATPSAAADAATKGYVDGLVTGRARVHAGTYNGNGASNRPINLGWRPRFVVMMVRYEESGQQRFEIFLRIDGAPYTARIRTENIASSNVFIEPISPNDIGITDTGFTLSSITTNASGRTYYYVAIG